MNQQGKHWQGLAGTVGQNNREITRLGAPAFIPNAAAAPS